MGGFYYINSFLLSAKTFEVVQAPSYTNDVWEQRASESSRWSEIRVGNTLDYDSTVRLRSELTDGDDVFRRLFNFTMRIEGGRTFQGFGEN